MPLVAVTTQGLVKTFGRVRALDSVSVEIAHGELFFLLGPSGCGKTTLLRTIAGFYVPDGGLVWFGQTDVSHVPPERRDTGMVFQNYALWPHMTVEANVAFGLRVRHVSRAERRRRVAEALAMVKMDTYATRRPNQLSGGQQQRVALARALVIRPRCLLLDEPLSNLDAKLRLEMRSDIRRLCKEFSLTGIYVTHDQKEALSIADRMAVMFNGQIAQVGTPRELYQMPTTAHVADFLGETNFIEARILTADGDKLRLETPLGQLHAIRRTGTATGGPCVLSIRPEAVRLGASAGAPNSFAAHVTSCTYLGDAQQIALQTGQLTLHAAAIERAATASLARDAAVTCQVDPADVVVLPPR